jgi:ATP-dependent Zn protease
LAARTAGKTTKRGEPMKHRIGVVIGSVAGALLLLALFNLFSTQRSTRRPPTIDYSSFIADVEANKVDAVTFRASGFAVSKKDGQLYDSYVPHVQVIPGRTDRLLAKGVKVSARPLEEDVPSVLSILVSWLPLILFYGVLYFAFARPLLAMARQVEALVKTIQEQSPSGPTSSA